MQDRTHVAEGLIGRDERREDTLGAIAVHVLDDAALPRARLRGVQHAEPDPVAEESGAGRALRAELDAAVGGAPVMRPSQLKRTGPRS